MMDTTDQITDPKFAADMAELTALRAEREQRKANMAKVRAAKGKPKPTKPTALKNAARAPTVAPKALPEFAGISPSDCCLDCDPEKCVITGAGICGHPMKGGLQAEFQRVPAIVKRFQRVRRILHDAKIVLSGT